MSEREARPVPGVSRRTFSGFAFGFSGATLLGGLGILGCANLLGCTGAPARGTIGAVLVRKADGRVVIRDVPEHLAAYRAGIRPGDELLLVDGQDVRRLTEDDLRRALSGLVDEPVNLTLTRGAEVLRLTVRRSMAEPYRLE